jgi:hypothetical protein
VTGCLAWTRSSSYLLPYTANKIHLKSNAGLVLPTDGDEQKASHVDAER